MTLPQNKLPQATRIELPRILANAFEQFPKREAVVVETAVGRSASFPHPRPKRLQQFRLCRDRRPLMYGWLSHSLQVSHEEPRAIANSDRFGGRIVAATAAAQMRTEAFERSVIQIMIG